MLNKVLGWLGNHNWYFPNSIGTNFQNIQWFLYLLAYSWGAALVLDMFI